MHEGQSLLLVPGLLQSYIASDHSLKLTTDEDIDTMGKPRNVESQPRAGLRHAPVLVTPATAAELAEKALSPPSETEPDSVIREDRGDSSGEPSSRVLVAARALSRCRRNPFFAIGREHRVQAAGSVAA